MKNQYMTKHFASLHDFSSRVILILIQQETSFCISLIPRAVRSYSRVRRGIFFSGLAPLARLPACNVLILGAQKKTLSGFSSTAVLPHAGFLFFHPIVQGVPPDLR